jgi:hypothetical protein
MRQSPTVRLILLLIFSVLSASTANAAAILRVTMEAESAQHQTVKAGFPAKYIIRVHNDGPDDASDVLTFNHTPLEVMP